MEGGRLARPSGTKAATRSVLPKTDRSAIMGYTMSRTKVSSKYQVVIPKEVRVRAGVRPGQEFQVIAKGGVITLVPDKPISSVRGIARGADLSGVREKKERF